MSPVPPRVTQRHRPSAPIVVEGEDVVINCPVDAVPIPTITWLKVSHVAGLCLRAGRRRECSSDLCCDEWDMFR